MEKAIFDDFTPEEFFDRCIQALHEKDRLGFAGRFIQGFVHNANGPLQNLSMLSELLLSGLEMQDRMFKAAGGEDPGWTELVEKQRKRLNQIRDQVFSLSGNLREFMQLHEIERSGADVDINSLLTRIAGVFRSDLFFKHKVRPELRLAKNLPPVRVPGRNIIPALFHLLQNAVTAMQDSPKKELVVETGVEGDHVLIKIIDTGCGSRDQQDPEPLFRLFESRWPNGTEEPKLAHPGFGLYAARRLLSPYGCTVNLEFGADATTATIRVPLSKR